MSVGSSKPGKTLSRLEEEPASGFFGATYTEITNVMKKAIIVAVITTVIFSILIRWELAAILSMLVGIAVFFILLKSIARNRADKPLYYHRHIKTGQSSLFIQPAKFYQRERNERNNNGNSKTGRKGT